MSPLRIEFHEPQEAPGSPPDGAPPGPPPPPPPPPPAVATVVWSDGRATVEADDPGVLLAIDPSYAARFLLDHGHIGLVTLGLVFLAVTGGEALYADLGHFGRKPIQSAWLGFVLPSLVINYFGQGALVLANPEAIENPFYRLMPEPLVIPMVVLATAATVIASQAVITGAFSLVRQAIQLGLLPRLAILHTSEAQSGQIYIPRVNTALLVGVLLLISALNYGDRIALSAVFPMLKRDLGVTDLELGFVGSAFLWAYGLGCPFAGFLAASTAQR